MDGFNSNETTIRKGNIQTVCCIFHVTRLIFSSKVDFRTNVLGKNVSVWYVSIQTSCFFCYCNVAKLDIDQARPAIKHRHCCFRRTELMRRIKRYKLAACSCIMLKHKKDDRYDNDKDIVTHDK